MLHSTTEHGGMSGMQDMDGLDLPAGKRVALAPHGMHLMLMGLKHPLVAGGKIDIELDFTNAGRVHVTVPVQPLAASGPPG
jgi:copper(I)-binding protein